MTRSRLAVSAGITGLVLLAVSLGAAGFGITAVARREYPARSTPAPVPSAYRAATQVPTVTAGPSGRPDSPAAVAHRLRGAVTAAGFGPRLRARVADAATGTVLLDRSGRTPAAPASTGKLLLAAALLDVRPATARITTTVRAGPHGAVVLVGGGDPTLSGAPAGRPGAYPEAARISDLAAQLRRAHVRPSRILVDDALFRGPTVSPDWAADDVPSDYAAAITPVLADGGRATPASVVRSATPDLDAGRELAAALHTPRLPVVRGAAKGRTLASVRSAPLGALIAQMLQRSDNVIAECLARQVALAEHRPATFTGSAAAIRTVLRRLGIDPGAGMVDGSGLAARDRVSAATLVAVLRLSARTPRLRALVSGLATADWSGTLRYRFVAGAGRAGAGVVRAKTGTLTGVSALAGFVHDRSGRLLAFALIADRAPSTPAAETALDALVGRLAGCGCSG